MKTKPSAIIPKNETNEEAKTIPCTPGTLNATIHMINEGPESNITLELEPGNYDGIKHFVEGTNNISIKGGNGVVFEGDPSQPDAAGFLVQRNGFKMEGVTFAGIKNNVALRILGNNAVVQSCKFEGIKSGISINGENSLITNCDITKYSKDCISVGNSGCTIEKTRMTHYTGIENDKDAHSDAIQLQYTGASDSKDKRNSGLGVLKNITIRDCVIDVRGDKNANTDATQGIMATQTILENFVCENNSVTVGSIHGISGAPTKDSWIEKNSVQTVPGSKYTAKITLRPSRASRSQKNIMVDENGNNIPYSVTLKGNKGVHEIHKTILQDSRYYESQNSTASNNKVVPFDTSTSYEKPLQQANKPISKAPEKIVDKRDVVALLQDQFPGKNPMQLMSDPNPIIEFLKQQNVQASDIPNMLFDKNMEQRHKSANDMLVNELRTGLG